MNETQCIELRDRIFATVSQGGSRGRPEKLFRFVAVEPGGIGHHDATVHFAYAPAVWERAGYACAPEDAMAIVEATINETPYKDLKIALTFHNYLRGGWPIAWGITAKDSYDNYPSLVLLETTGGRVRGVLMRDSHCGGSFDARVAQAYAEPHEAEDLIDELLDLELHDRFLGLYKECDIAADSIDAAIAMTPETNAGQKHVLVYREMEWLSGLWNNPSKANAFPMTLHSVADFHGTRVSAAKRGSRGGLEVAKANQTMPGDYDVLEKALALLTENDDDEEVDYEAIPAIQLLCDWWNTHAPETMRSAALFRVYIWNSNRRIFIAGDPEEPAVQSEAFSSFPASAIFEREGRPTVALNFFRGRAFNKANEHGTMTFYANGEEAYDVGVDLNEVDEAYYTLLGLRAIKDL